MSRRLLKKLDVNQGPGSESLSFLPTTVTSFESDLALLFPLGSGSSVKGMEQFQKLGVVGGKSQAPTQVIYTWLGFEFLAFSLLIFKGKGSYWQVEGKRPMNDQCTL